MNILMLPSLYHPHLGGVELVVGNLARQFVAMGHRVEIVTTRWPRDLPSREVVDGIKVTRLPFALPLTLKSTATLPLRLLQSYCGLKKVLASTHSDLVNLHYLAEAAFYAGLCCRAQNVPIVASIHGSDIELIPNRSGLQRRVTTRLLREAAAIVANSKYLANSACRLAGEGIRPQVTTIGNAVALPRLETLTEPPGGLPARYILGVGRLIKTKGFDLLVRAFATLEAARPDTHLVVVGDGIERTALQQLSASFGLADRVHFVGRMPNEAIPAYMRHAELVAVPSRREGFGLVALEAMACRKAVVAMPVGGLPEVVSDGQSGLLAAEPTAKALGESLAFLLDRPKLAEEFGRRGRQLVESRNTWRLVAESYVRIFESVLQIEPGIRGGLKQQSARIQASVSRDS
jgi:glycosyltransferase involved in cell wall biosynthesis